jgi:hypothetical protein
VPLIYPNPVSSIARANSTNFFFLYTLHLSTCRWKPPAAPSRADHVPGFPPFRGTTDVPFDFFP